MWLRNNLVSVSPVAAAATGWRCKPTILFGLALLHCLGYGSLWALLHVPNVIPPVSNGWFTPGSKYGAFVVHLPLFTWLSSRLHVAELLLLLGFVLLAALYTCTIILVQRWSIIVSTRMLISCTALIALPLLFLPHLFSSDVYSYALFGRIPLLYGGNPFVDPPARFAADPLLGNIYWKTTASVYGPVWIIVSLPVTALAQALGGSAGMYVLLYKLVAFAAYLAGMVVMRRLLLDWMPERATWGPMMYAWHPLVLIEFVGSGHNDSLMVLLVLLALLLAQRRRQVLTVALFVLAGLVKLVALLLVPLYLLYTLRTSRAQQLPLVMKQSIVGLVIVTALYAPFWAGPSTLAILRTAPPLTLLHDSPADWIAAQITHARCEPERTSFRVDRSWEQTGPAVSCPEAIQTSARLASLALFVLVFVGLLLLPASNFGQLLERTAQILLAYIVLAGVHFEPWYVTWLLALTPLLPRRRVLFALWGCTILLLYSTWPLPGRLVIAYAPLILQALRVSLGKASTLLVRYAYGGAK